MQRTEDIWVAHFCNSSHFAHVTIKLKLLTALQMLHVYRGLVKKIRNSEQVLDLKPTSPKIALWGVCSSSDPQTSEDDYLW